MRLEQPFLDIYPLEGKSLGNKHPFAYYYLSNRPTQSLITQQLWAPYSLWLLVIVAVSNIHSIMLQLKHF